MTDMVREHDHQAPTGSQLSCTQGEKSLPVPRSLTLKLGAYRAGASGNGKVARNSHRETAQPHDRIRAPRQMNVIMRENPLVKGPSDRTWKDVCIVAAVPLCVRIKNLEQGIEIVRGLVHMKHKDRPVRREMGTDFADGSAQGNERVLPLGRSIIDDDNGFLV